MTSRSPMFVFEPSSNSVVVSGIPSNVEINEVLSIFEALVGKVTSSKSFDTQNGRELEVELTGEDAVRKALSLSGHSFGDIQLTITKPTGSGKRTTDDRKNLYVLGLPFSLTKAEFTALFSQYGVVNHSVILATVDNSSRRRGFVVMSSHEEAKFAMKSLSRTQIKGHTLDISWAVVQRSQGFLDGGDRSLVLDARTHASSTPVAPQEKTELNCESSQPGTPLAHGRHDLASLALAHEPTATLLVTNLPMFLFCEDKDMHPLLRPFGRINKMTVVKSLANPCTSVVVEFESTKVAEDAKENIQGQWYSGYQVTAQFVHEIDYSQNPSSSSSGYFHDAPNTNASNAFNASCYPSSFKLPPCFSRQASSYNEHTRANFPEPRSCNLDAPASIYSARHHRRNPFLLHH